MDVEELQRRIKRHPVMRTSRPGELERITLGTCWCGSDISKHTKNWDHPWRHILDTDQYSPDILSTTFCVPVMDETVEWSLCQLLKTVKADWLYDDELEMHIPSCSRLRVSNYPCHAGPLVGEQIITGDCGEHENPDRKLT